MATCRFSGALLALAVSVAAAHADPINDLVDACNSEGDPARTISGCTEYLSFADLVLDAATKGKLYFNRGQAYGEKGDTQRALADFTTAIGLDPTLGPARLNRGAIYSKLENYTEAIADFDACIQMGFQPVDAHFNRGVAYAGLGDKAHAVADFRTVLSLNPADQAAKFALSQLGESP